MVCASRVNVDQPVADIGIGEDASGSGQSEQTGFSYERSVHSLLPSVGLAGFRIPPRPALHERCVDR